MAALSINFTPAPGITSYNICYRPVGATTPFICVDDSGPILISVGIECGVAYDVTVRTNCPEGEYSTIQSTSVTTVATALECGEPSGDGTCYTITMPYEAAQRDGRDLYIGFRNSVEGIQLVSVNMLPNFDTGSGIALAVCSVYSPTFRYGYDGFDELVFDINVTPGGSCNVSSDCTPLI